MSLSEQFVLKCPELPACLAIEYAHKITRNRRLSSQVTKQRARTLLANYITSNRAARRRYLVLLIEAGVRIEVAVRELETRHRVDLRWLTECLTLTYSSSDIAVFHNALIPEKKRLAIRKELLLIKRHIEIHCAHVLIVVDY